MRGDVTMAIAVTAVVVGVGAADRAAVADAGRGNLVFLGTIVSIEPVGSELKPWVVSTQVKKVLSGEFSGKSFSFAVHSPSRSGLEKGHSYTIKAVWRGNGYEVDENQWRVPSGFRGAVGPLGLAAEPRVAAYRAVPGR